MISVLPLLDNDQHVLAQRHILDKTRDAVQLGSRVSLRDGEPVHPQHEPAAVETCVLQDELLYARNHRAKFAVRVVPLRVVRVPRPPPLV